MGTELQRLWPTHSPYWLRVNGIWCQLEGTTPGTPISTARPSSDFVTLGGRRFVQHAARGPREWSISFAWANPLAVTLLKVTAEGIDTDDLLLLDTALAQANMLDPRDCYGSNSTAAVVSCGGVPLRAFTAATTQTVEVRAGVTYWLRLWGGAVGEEVVTGTYPGGTITGDPLTRSSVLWPATYPADWPGTAPGDNGILMPITPTADGVLSVTAAAGTAGLMVSQDFSAQSFLAGERIPCLVTAADPMQTMQRYTSKAPSMSDFAVTLREVG